MPLNTIGKSRNSSSYLGGCEEVINVEVEIVYWLDAEYGILY